MANLTVVGLGLSALFMFSETSDTNYLVCAAVLVASCYLKQNDDDRHDKLVGALFDIEDRAKR
ncbi:MAG: hypothetical protein V2I27_00215 [Erythrobacter sp.]|jgi:hypothetical protein|nr:hypothetical protein [Erythrobacter sp.]